MEYPVVYDDQWTDDCIRKLCKETDLLREMHHDLLAAKCELGDCFAYPLQELIDGAEKLEQSIHQTLLSIEGYQHNMYCAYHVIQGKIEEAKLLNQVEFL